MLEGFFWIGVLTVIIDGWWYLQIGDSFIVGGIVKWYNKAAVAQSNTDAPNVGSQSPTDGHSDVRDAGNELQD